jgi:hypothetical protein
VAARVRQQPALRLMTQRVGVHHAHGCNVCGRRFSDTCAHPLGPRTCPTCALGQPPTQEDRDRAPRACCEAYSRPIADVDELSKYNLGGHTPWFRCAGVKGCSRTHPFDPTNLTKEST